MYINRREYVSIYQKPKYFIKYKYAILSTWMLKTDISELNLHTYVTACVLMHTTYIWIWVKA